MCYAIYHRVIIIRADIFQFSQTKWPKRSIGFAETPDRYCTVGKGWSASDMGKCDCFRLHNDTYFSGEMARLFSVLQQLHKNPHAGKRTVLKYTCSSCSQVNLKCDIFLDTLYYFYHPLTKLWEGHIFGRVCLSFCPRREGVLCDHYPWCSWPHCTGSWPWHCTGPQPPPSGILWSRLEIWWNLFTWRPLLHLVLTSSGWLLKYIQWASRRYTSY